MAPRGDPTAVAAEAPAGPSPSGRHSVFHPLRVAALERLTDDALAITFDVPAELADAYRYAPGQHLTLRCPEAGDDVRRTYSICAPATSGVLRVGVRRLAGGVFSTHAFERLRTGDLIDVMTPAGRFTVPLSPGRAGHYCAIAAGSGITPVLSILSTALEVEPESRCTLLYGNRTTRSIMFLEELEDLKDRHLGRFQLVHVLSRERQEAELLNGRLDADKLRELLTRLVDPRTVDEWFLCGPLPMIDAARAVLLEREVAPERIHRELFHLGATAPTRSAPPPERSDGSSVTVVLDGRQTTVPVPPLDTILDAVLAVRADAPYACKNGMCGTCRARLVAGTVEMDHNYVLEPQELAQGFVLACQARPTSRTVTLDFDA